VPDDVRGPECDYGYDSYKEMCQYVEQVEPPNGLPYTRTFTITGPVRSIFYFENV